jgi:hypothetical protein
MVRLQKRLRNLEQVRQARSFALVQWAGLYAAGPDCILRRGFCCGLGSLSFGDFYNQGFSTTAGFRQEKTPKTGTEDCNRRGRFSRPVQALEVVLTQVIKLLHLSLVLKSEKFPFFKLISAFFGHNQGLQKVR